MFSLPLLLLCLCQEVLPSLTLYPEGAVPLGHAWLRVPSLMPSVAGGSDFGSFVLRCWVPLCCSRFRFRLVPVVPLALPVCGLVCPLLLLLLFCSPSSPPSSSSADSFGVGLSCGCWGAVGCGPPSSPSPPHWVVFCRLFLYFPCLCCPLSRSVHDAGTFLVPGYFVFVLM